MNHQAQHLCMQFCFITLVFEQFGKPIAHLNGALNGAPDALCVQGINMIILSECIHLPCEIVTVLTVSMQQDQRLALAFFYEMMLDVHAGMSCDPESASFASSEYRILNPDIEPTVRFKLRKNE